MAAELNNMILTSIRNDVAVIGSQLKVIAQRVIEEGISDYPVFIASQQILDIGKPIFDRDEIQINWFFNASILEDFLRRDLVSGAKLGEFRDAFGDPQTTACIFVVADEQGQFVFVPYDLEGANEEDLI